MIYVLDTNIFSHSFKNLNFSVFEDMWEIWENWMRDGKIISVDEVYCELLRYYSKECPEFKWISKNKDAFLKPNNLEGQVLAQIFGFPKFREGIKEKSLREGTPEADAFLVAKAKIVGGILVTNEKYKDNSEKIPNICKAFNVPYIHKDTFYRIIRNTCAGKNEYDDVLISYGHNKEVHFCEEEIKRYIEKNSLHREETLINVNIG